MRMGMLRITHIILVLSAFLSGDLWAANDSNPVVVDGDRISIHAEGIYLGELLMVVEKKTGVQFRFDEFVATKEIFLDFQDLPLSEGIKKIIHPYSWATIYDNIGKLRKVIILERWKGSEMEVPRQEGNDFPGGPKPGPSDSISFTTKGTFYGSGASKGSLLEIGPGPSGGSLLEALPVPGVGSSDLLPIPNSEHGRKSFLSIRFF